MTGLVLTILLDDLLPIFLVALVGYALSQLAHVDAKPLSRITFNALSPSLVFSQLVTTTVGAGEAGQIVAFTILLVLAIGLVARVVAIPFKLSRPELVGFLIAVMFSNAGNFGLSVVLFAFGREHLARAVLYFVTSALMVYSLGVVVASSGRQTVRRALVGLLRVPAVWGAVAAAIVMTAGLRIPAGLMRPVELLSDAAIPCMLLVLGMQFERGRRPERPGLVAAASMLALVVTPALGFGLAALLGMDGPAREAAIVQAGMPSAVVTTILALEFDVAPNFVTSVVLLTTILSPITVTALITLLKVMP